MFFKRFILSAIILFTLVHFIACAVEHPETDENSSTTINKPKDRKIPPRLPSTKKNQQMKFVEYSNDSDVDAINEATSSIGSGVNEPEAKGLNRKRVKRSESKTNELENNNDNKEKSKPKSFRRLSKQSSRSLPTETDQFEYPKDEHNFSETSQSFLESPPPKKPFSSRLKKQNKIDSVQPGTDGLQRISRKAKLDKETSGMDEPILSNEPTDIENNMYNDAEIPYFVESLPENEEEDIMDAQDVSPFYKPNTSNNNMIISIFSSILSGLPGKHILNFDDSLSDEELDTLDRYDPIKEETDTQELDQSSEEPVILSIFKVVMKSLWDMFSALKDIIQRSRTQEENREDTKTQRKY